MRNSRLRELLLIAALSAAFGTAAFFYQGVAAKSFSFGVLLVSVGFWATSLVLGRAAVGLTAPDHHQVDAIEALVTGALLVAVSLMTLAFTAPTTIVTNAALVVLVTILAIAARSRRAPGVLALDRDGWIAIGVALVASGLWSFENLQGLETTPSGFVSHPWVDVFFHAQRIALFARADGPQALADPAMAGAPLPPYHYASYFPAALVSSVARVDAYGLATGLLPTLGTQLTGLVAYVLGRACFGRPGGLAASLGVLLVPDPSFLHVSSRFTSYHFYQQVGPGGSYAVAAMGLAWVWAYRAVRHQRLRYVIAALVGGGLVGLFKIQIAVAYGLGLLLFACGALRLRSHRLSCAAAVLAAYVALLGAAHYVPRAPTMELSTGGLHEVLQLLGSRLPVDHARWWFGLLPAEASYLREVVVGLPLVLLCIYGVWLIGIVPSAFTMPNVSRLPLWLPALALGSHVAVLTVIAPNRGPQGDAFEVILKTLVWPYFLVAAWVSAALADRLRRSSLWASRSARVGAVALGIAMFVVVGRCGRVVQWGMAEDPNFHSHNFMRLLLPSGFVAAARWVRDHTAPQDVVQWSYNDGALAFSALSERAEYFARATINTGHMTPEGERRLQAFQGLWNARDRATASQVAGTLGIHWFVVADRHRAPWENDPASSPAFAADGYRVYEMKPLPPA